MSNNDFLYLKVKSDICNNIYKGIYQEGEKLPSERKMSEQMQVSRVTIRRALESLEKEGIINRIQGSGSYISGKNKGYSGNLDVVALVSSMRNDYFAQFISEFQKYADINKTLVLFLQKTKGFTLEDCILKVYEKNVHDVVIWAEDEVLEPEKIKRLRMMGVNMVIFDDVQCDPYVDCVYLDNEDAVELLYRFLTKEYGNEIVYIGWDSSNIFSLNERKKHFNHISNESSTILTLPWEERYKPNLYLEQLCEKYEKELKSADAILCENRAIGIAMTHALNNKRISTKVASLDDSDTAKEYQVSVYRQDFKEMAKCVYDRLKNQNQDSLNWKASRFPVKGSIIKRKSV